MAHKSTSTSNNLAPVMNRNSFGLWLEQYGLINPTLFFLGHIEVNFIFSRHN